MCYLPLCYISHKDIYGTSPHYTIVLIGSIISLYVLCSGTGSVLFGAWYLYGGAGRFHYKCPCFTAVVIMAGVCAGSMGIKVLGYGRESCTDESVGSLIKWWGSE